jgi:diguanylate cyclase (GGDEF)-like protein
LASQEPALLAVVEPVLNQSGARVQIVLSADAAQAALTAPAPPHLALLDARLPHLDLGRLLAIARADDEHRIPIVLFSDTVSEELKDWLRQGVLDDLLPTTHPPQHNRHRPDHVQRAPPRNALARTDRTDRLTGVYTRDAILSLLFRETDRVQRMNTSLCFILFDIDDFGHWNVHLGAAVCDALLVQVSERVSRLLRSYDLLGRVGKDEFLAALPGCTAHNAVLLAERIRAEVFAAPFPADTPPRTSACTPDSAEKATRNVLCNQGKPSVGPVSPAELDTDFRPCFHAARPDRTAVRLTACFAVAPSNGRSPIVVLREAEEALRQAREAGPETIQCSTACSGANPAPAAFLSPAASDDLLAW